VSFVNFMSFIPFVSFTFYTVYNFRSYLLAPGGQIRILRLFSVRTTPVPWFTTSSN